MNEKLELHREELAEVLGETLLADLRAAGADESAITDLRADEEAWTGLLRMLELCAVQYQAGVVVSSVGGLAEETVDQVSSTLAGIIFAQFGPHLGRQMWLSAGDSMDRLSRRAAAAEHVSWDVIGKMRGDA